MDNRRHRVHHYTPDPYGSQGPPQPGPYVPPDPYYAPQQHDQSFQPMGQPFQAGINYMPTDYNVMFQSGVTAFTPVIQNMVSSHATDALEKGRSWVGHMLKYYFAVDTAYVLKKLLLLFFPFTHKDWSVKYTPNEAIAPRDDLNSPDLYIPCMSFVTYVLVSGFLLGTNNEFSPEKLGLQASSALAWLIMEVLLILMALYLLSISSCLGFFHLLAFSSYKFVPMIGALVVSYVISRSAYYGFLLYSSLSLAFFLLRSLHLAIQTTSTGHNNSAKHGLYLVLIICGTQSFVMYWLTRHLVNLNSNSSN